MAQDNKLKKWIIDWAYGLDDIPRGSIQRGVDEAEAREAFGVEYPRGHIITVKQIEDE